MTPATSERWNAIEELYVLVEGLSAEERERQLGSRAPELAAAVRELFASIENEEAAQGRLAAEARQSAPFAPRVPGYELLDPIGSGGAGAVYRGQRLIDQGSPQPVAVKVFHSHRAGLVDRQRFVRELRIVAALDHPAIVKFFDGGFTPEGRPFLVMEMVEGLPVTAHCETRQLDLEERIRLLLAIFDAIAWAHARFVVHLDLKPSNILVTAHGTPKVLDFGAARLLDFAGDLTVTQQITPQYASPERLRGEAPTVASDVYSLGLLMFEVLSGGGWPFSSRDSILGLAERAVNKDALTPLPDAAGGLAFQARLRGDLDAICTKALAFNSGERYETVSDLAADLRRVLTGEPVLARANNLLYRVRKFTARHLIRLAIAAVFVLGLGVAALYSAVQARQARHSAEQARRSVAALEQLLSESNYGRSSGGRDMTVKELLATGSARIAPTLVSDPALGADFALVLTSGFVAQADYAHARVTADQAVQFARASADDVRSALALAASSTVSYHENRPDAAWNEAQRAVALWQSNRRAFSTERSIAVLMAAGSILLYSKPSDPAAGEVYEACLRIAPQASQERATCLEGFSNSLIYGRTSYREALPLLEEALAIRRGGAIINPLALAVLLQTYGMANRFVEHYREDEASQREALALATGALGPGALQTANFRAVWASSLAGVGRAKEGLAEAEAALAVYRLQFKERGSNLLWTPLSAAMTNACLVERFADCERYAREAVETLGRDPSPKDSRLLSAHGHLGWALAHLGKQQDARVLLSEAIAAYHQQNRRPLAMEHLEAALKAITEQ